MLEALQTITLVRYKNRRVGLIGDAKCGLVEDLPGLPADNADHRRVMAVCRWALEYCKRGGYAPGKMPGEHARTEQRGR